MDLHSYVNFAEQLSNQENISMLLLVDKDDETRSQIVSDRLSELAHHFQKYASPSECIDHIEKLPKMEKVIIVIINVLHSQSLISALDTLKQIHAVYTIDNTDHHPEKRIRRFDNTSSLLEHVETTTVSSKNQCLPFRLLNQEQRLMLDLSKEAASFMWGQLALFVLQELPVNQNTIGDMVTVCADFYHYDDWELKCIDEFRRVYKAEDAVKWYSRSCFIFRLVNRVLRIEDIDGLFTFRQFIIDLHKQIADEHRKQRKLISLRVYRGQVLKTAELEQFKIAIGNLISINTFFSTSIDRQVAELFLGRSEMDKTVRVLFIIDVDMSLESTLCADISALSVHHDEYEVLFSCSPVFQLKNIRNNEKRDFWEIYLVATDKGRETLPNYKRMMAETAQESNAHLLFGKFLLIRG